MHPKIRLGEIDPAENLGVLLVEFFELYGFYFNYNTIGISINNGGSYFSKMQRGWQDMTKPWLLSVADPTDESAHLSLLSLKIITHRNIANDVSRGSFQMLRLRQTLGGAALILTTRLLEISDKIRSLNEGYHFQLRQPEPLQTVLGKLIAMSPEVRKANNLLRNKLIVFKAVRQRKAISDAFHGGELQRALKLPPPSRSISSGLGGTASQGVSINHSRDAAGKSLRMETHAFSEGDSEEDPTDGDDQGAERDEEDSRYQNKNQTSRRTSNRFESLAEHNVQYVLSDSEEMDLESEGDGISLSHANKRRKVDTKPSRPKLVPSASRRSYWASKGQERPPESP